MSNVATTVECSNCNGCGFVSQKGNKPYTTYDQCATCQGFGTLIVREDDADETD